MDSILHSFPFCLLSFISLISLFFCVLNVIIKYTEFIDGSLNDSVVSHPHPAGKQGYKETPLTFYVPFHSFCFCLLLHFVFSSFFLILLFLKSFSVYTIHFYYTNIKDDIELHVLRSVWSAHNCLHFIIYWSCICHSCQYSMPLYNTNHLL